MVIFLLLSGEFVLVGGYSLDGKISVTYGAVVPPCKHVAIARLRSHGHTKRNHLGFSSHHARIVPDGERHAVVTVDATDHTGVMRGDRQIGIQCRQGRGYSDLIAIDLVFPEIFCRLDVKTDTRAAHQSHKGGACRKEYVS